LEAERHCLGTQKAGAVGRAILVLKLILVLVFILF